MQFIISNEQIIFINKSKDKVIAIKIGDFCVYFLHSLPIFCKIRIFKGNQRFFEGTIALTLSTNHTSGNNSITTNKANNNKTILLVEDNDLNIEIANELLCSSGFNVICATNGQEALNTVINSKTGDIDLILMDIQMPIMNGYETTKNIRKLDDAYKANIPIIAMTANAFSEDRDEAFEVGMNGFILKPIDINEVLTTIDKFLKK